MDLYELVRFIEFLAQIKHKAIQIKNMYKQKINIISNRIGFRIYNKMNNTKIFNMIHSDLQGNIYYSNNAKSIYTFANQFLFIAYDIIQKTFIIVEGNSFKKEYILNEKDESLVEKILGGEFAKIFVINKNYFANRIDYLIENIQFIKENMNSMIELYHDYRYNIIDYLADTKILLNCFIDIGEEFETNQIDNLNNCYKLLFEHILFYSVYPSVDIETRIKLNNDISSLQYEINNLLITYNLQDYIRFINFETAQTNYSKLTSFSIATYSFYFDDFIDILLLSEFVESINVL